MKRLYALKLWKSLRKMNRNNEKKYNENLNQVFSMKMKRAGGQTSTTKNIERQMVSVGDPVS